MVGLYQQNLTHDMLTFLAEDFYGNDYPEDEVDTDDENGRGSYNYRLRGSDDEEYGDDEPTWSDAEND